MTTRDDMKPDDDDERLAAQARDLFRKQVSATDSAAANRLRLMRREALTASGAAMPRFGLGAAVAAVLLLAGISLWQGQLDIGGKPTIATAPPPSDLTLATSDADAQMYAWLGDAPVAVEPSADRL